MPRANVIACAIIVNLSTVTYLIAVYVTSYPVVVMVKSCNIVSVVLVGVCCSRVRDKSLKLGPKKIAVAFLVSVGILLYNFAGNSPSKTNDRSSSYLGIFLLIVSLILDGFLPDFQAVLKS